MKTIPCSKCGCNRLAIPFIESGACKCREKPKRKSKTFPKRKTLAQQMNYFQEYLKTI